MKTFSEFMDDLVEIAVVKRERKTSAERMKGKQMRRKTKMKRKQYMKKYKKSSGAKALARKGERMKKQGKTATGRAISVAGGSGAAERQKERKKELQKR